MLLALMAQMGNLAKLGIRKHENHRKLRQVESDLKQESKWKLNDQSRLALGDLPDYRLSLTGKFEPISDLPTIDLYHNSSKNSNRCLASGISCYNIFTGGTDYYYYY